MRTRRLTRFALGVLSSVAAFGLLMLAWWVSLIIGRAVVSATEEVWFGVAAVGITQLIATYAIITGWALFQCVFVTWW